MTARCRNCRDRRASPRVAILQAFGGIRRRLAAVLPGRLRERLLGSRGVPAVGRVRFGDLRRLTPISQRFGFDRGLPVDRYYIERFLARHALGIVGRVLEIGDDTYTRKFGGSARHAGDVLHVHPGNPRATFVATSPTPTCFRRLPSTASCSRRRCSSFTTSALAIARIHRALAPGGVVLVTAPGISQIDRGEWGKTWFWSFTPAALLALFSDVFGPDAVMVERYGNVFAATAFLQGLAVEELDTSDLDPIDQAYPVIVALRARKRV